MAANEQFPPRDSSSDQRPGSSIAGYDEEKQKPSPDVASADHMDDSAPLEDEKPVAPPSHGAAPPDGGMTAWLQVLGGFFLFFNTWGILNTFGVYQTYYESGQLFDASSSDISWIGSVQACMLLLTCVVAGPVYDRGYLRALLITGTFLIVFGHMMLSLCHTLWQCVLAQGFVVGMGAGCLFIPAVAITPTYFSKKIGLAIGLAAAGSSTGGIIYPIMFYKLINEIGFGWGVRILGFTALATGLVPIFVMKMRVKPAKARSLIDWSAFTDVPYITFVIGTVIGYIGLYIGLFYISYYGQATGVTDESLSFYLVPILNAASVFGRTLPNLLSDKIGPLNVLIPGTLIVGIILFCLDAVHSAAGLIVETLLFGFFSGVLIALPPVCFVALTQDKSKVGTRVGMGFGMIAFGVLAAGPGAGGILGTDDAHLNWTGVWVYGGVVPVAAACIFLTVRVMKAGAKVAVRA